MCCCFFISFRNMISSDRRLLTTAIDTLSNLCNTLNGDSTVATYQGRVAMSFHTLTGAEYATQDSRSELGFYSSSTFNTDGNHRILFYTAYLTTAIDITSSCFEFSSLKSSHCTVSDDDSCSTFWVGNTITVNTYHGRLTIESAGATLKGFTLTTTEYATSNRSSITGRNGFFIHST